MIESYLPFIFIVITNCFSTSTVLWKKCKRILHYHIRHTYIVYTMLQLFSYTDYTVRLGYNYNDKLQTKLQLESSHWATEKASFLAKDRAVLDSREFHNMRMLWRFTSNRVWSSSSSSLFTSSMAMGSGVSSWLARSPCTPYFRSARDRRRLRKAAQKERRKEVHILSANSRQYN